LDHLLAWAARAPSGEPAAVVEAVPQVPSPTDAFFRRGSGTPLNPLAPNTSESIPGPIEGIFPGRRPPFLNETATQENTQMKNYEQSAGNTSAKESAKKESVTIQYELPMSELIEGLFFGMSLPKNPSSLTRLVSCSAAPQ
jgi:hypothetical protein